MPNPPVPTASVVVATYNRPDHVRTCLEHLSSQTVRPVETVVVDSSPDLRTREVVDAFPEVRYVRNDKGPGTLATSRGIGVEATEGEVIAFIDDDAFAEPDWLEHLLLPYLDPQVAAVGGRALNQQPGEESEGVDSIGRLLPNGRLTGYFAADPGKDLDVDHMLGANMSVRRSVVESLGGIHDYYPGTCLREDTDMPLRMRRAGYRVVYTPRAVVEHVAAPYSRGRRFDLRYTYYGQRNHMVLLSRTLGMTDPHFRRYAVSAAREIVGDVGSVGRVLRDPERSTPESKLRGAAGALSRAAVKTAGMTAGTVQAVRLRLAEGPVPPASGPRLTPR